MNEEQSRKILAGDIGENGSLLANRSGPFIHWAAGDAKVCLDGDFTAEYLEAVVWWMRNAKEPASNKVKGE